MTSLIAGEPSTASAMSARAATGTASARSLPAAPVAGNAASAIGTTSRRVEQPADRLGDPLSASGSPLRRLSTMASMREWEQRSTPVVMHEAILAGESPRNVAEAAHLTTAEAHVCWNAWASRRLAPPGADETMGVTVRQYLRVHEAFAATLLDEPVLGEMP